MVYICLVLLRVVLVLAMKIGFDAGAAALGFIAEGIKRLRRLVRQRRTHKKLESWYAEHGGAPDEVREDFHDVPPDEDFMSEAQQSFLRGLLKFAAGALVAKGVIDVGDAAGLQVALEALVGGVVGLWAFWQSHRKHAA